MTSTDGAQSGLGRVAGLALLALLASASLAFAQAPTELAAPPGTAPLTVSNVGNGPLTVSLISDSSPYFWAGRSSLTLSAGTSDTLGLHYAPSYPEPDTAPWLLALARWQDGIGPTGHAWLLLSLVWLFIAAVVLGASRPGGFVPWLGWTVAGLGVALVVVGSSWWAVENRLERIPRAVVVTPAVEVLAGPSDSNAAVFTAHEGLRVDVRDESGGWVQVSIPGGLHGWVPRVAIERI